MDHKNLDTVADKEVPPVSPKDTDPFTDKEKIRDDDTEIIPVNVEKDKNQENPLQPGLAVDDQTERIEIGRAHV